jgi:hypothetical protein
VQRSMRSLPQRLRSWRTHLQSCPCHDERERHSGHWATPDSSKQASHPRPCLVGAAVGNRRCHLHWSGRQGSRQRNHSRPLLRRHTQGQALRDRHASTDAALVGEHVRRLRVRSPAARS